VKLNWTVSCLLQYQKMHLMETTSNSSLVRRKSGVSLLNKESPLCCFEENAHVNLRRKYLSYIASPRSFHSYHSCFYRPFSYTLLLYNSIFSLSIIFSLPLLTILFIFVLFLFFFHHISDIFKFLTNVRTLWEGIWVEVQVDPNRSFLRWRETKTYAL